MEAWQRAVASMQLGELAWVKSPPRFAYGELGVPGLVPAGEHLWSGISKGGYRHKGGIDIRFSMDIHGVHGPWISMESMDIQGLHGHP